MSYTKLRYHIITATKQQKPLLVTQVEQVAHAMITRSAEEQGAHVFQVGGMPNHTHMVADLPSQITLSNFVQRVKNASSWFINKHNMVKGGFEWAEGYAAISLSPNDLSPVMTYVAQQKWHHQTNHLWKALEKLPLPNEPSYTRLRYHLISGTKHREQVIVREIENTIYHSFDETAKEQGCVILKTGGIDDHVHTVAAIRPQIRVSYFVRDIKKYAARAVNKKKLLEGGFTWQKGYGAFTLWPFDLSGVLDYVANQKQHHKEGTLWDEYEKIDE